jgi:hypothetical protein
MEDKKPDPNQTLKGCAILIVFIGVVGALFYFGGCFNESPESKERSDKIKAYTFAEQFVEQRLKSPSTADFPFDFMDHVSKIGEDQYKIESWVDAQNSFGATVRNRVQVVLTLSEDRETATLDMIEIY